MRLWRGPVRWSKKGSDAPKELQEAMRSAQARMGTRDQVHRIARRLESQIGRLNASMTPGTTFLGKQTSSVSGIQTLLSVFAIAISTTVVLWNLPSDQPAQTPSLETYSPDKLTPAVKPNSRATITLHTLEYVESSSDAVAEKIESLPVKTVKTHPRSLQSSRSPRRRAPVVKTLDPEDELKILRRAQDDLAARPLRALRETERHRRDYPSGVFAQEREMIAIEALFQLSRVKQGLNRARRFLERYGDSTHAPRVRSLLEESK